MGTDIHFRVESREDANSPWRVVKPGHQPNPFDYEGADPTIEDWPTPRNYAFFACVAGVRNGTGFAGVYTHEPITPLSEPRGLPADMASTQDADEALSGQDGDDYERADREGLAWLGDHSFTWATLAELQSYFRQPQVLVRGGVVELPILAEMNEITEQPKEWSGGISGHRVVHLPLDLAWAMSRHQDVVEAANSSGVLICANSRWRASLLESIDPAYMRLIFEEWPRLGEPDNVRVIMGFDS